MDIRSYNQMANYNEPKVGLVLKTTLHDDSNWDNWSLNFCGYFDRISYITETLIMFMYHS